VFIKAVFENRFRAICEGAQDKGKINIISYKFYGKMSKKA